MLIYLPNPVQKIIKILKSNWRKGKIETPIEYENSVIAFDDLLGSSIWIYMDQFFMRGRHNKLDIYYISQSYFALAKVTIRNDSKKIILFNQTSKDIENI